MRLRSPPDTGAIMRFGPFELDVLERDLRRDGQRLHMQDQPMELLIVLVERPGRLVTRAELRRRLWPADTFVDFQHGVNAAVKRLRDGLGDSAENPAFIETVPRRGYRFIAPVASETGTSALLGRLWAFVTRRYAGGRR
jgi:DNA-binding winged helix-turn-helix (wHTH) protein